MKIASALKSPWVKYGLIAAGGVVVYMMIPKGQAQEQAQQGGIDPNMLALLPSLMGGGGGGGVGGPPEIPTNSLLDLIPDLGEPAAPPSQESTPGFLESAWNSFLQSDIAYALGLASAANPGKNVAYTGSGIIAYRDPDTITSAEIREFITAQAQAGVPINAATISAWSQQYGVPIERIGAAYGMTPSQSADWLVRNSQTAAVAAQESRARQSNASLPSVYTPTQQTAMHQNWGSNATYYVSPSGNVASVSAKGGVAITRGYLYDSAGNIIGVRPD